MTSAEGETLPTTVSLPAASMVLTTLAACGPPLRRASVAFMQGEDPFAPVWTVAAAAVDARLTFPADSV